MTQTTSRFFDELAKVMTNAAGAAQGLRREIDTLVRAQAERVMGDMDVVMREEFDAVREMAVLAREENERLGARISALEAELKKKPEKKTPGKVRVSKSPAAKPRAAKSATKTKN